MAEKVSLIIPTLNAASEIGPLLDKLESQTLVPDEIVVVDSQSEDDTVSIVNSYSKGNSNICIKQIAKKDFNHGLTRDKALRDWTTGEFVLFLTQDAVPANDNYIEYILKPFSDHLVAVSSGRQLPKHDARLFEQLVRQFNYPDKSFTRDRSDLYRYGIKTFYTSDVCSAYRRSAYLECGGFCSTMMSEDMYMAAKFVGAGYKVAYSAEAQVFHSHNLTLNQQYKRNFAVGLFLEEHKDVLMNASEIGEGKRLVKHVAGELLRSGRLGEFVAFGCDCVARFAGNRAGRKRACERKVKGN